MRTTDMIKRTVALWRHAYGETRPVYDDTGPRKCRTRVLHEDRRTFYAVCKRIRGRLNKPENVTGPSWFCRKTVFHRTSTVIIQRCAYPVHVQACLPSSKRDRYARFIWRGLRLERVSRRLLLSFTLRSKLQFFSKYRPPCC